MAEDSASRMGLWKGNTATAVPRRVRSVSAARARDLGLLSRAQVEQLVVRHRVRLVVHGIDVTWLGGNPADYPATDINGAKRPLGGLPDAGANAGASRLSMNVATIPPGAVAYDAVEAGRTRGHDVVIIDTAGRLHTQDHLMEELAKIWRTIARRNLCSHVQAVSYFLSPSTRCRPKALAPFF